MGYSIRQGRFPVDCAHQAEVLRSVKHDSPSSVELQKRASESPAGSVRVVHLACDELGAPLGYAEAFHHRDHMPGVFWLSVTIIPAARGQGVGAALARANEEALLAMGGTIVRGEVKEVDLDAMAFSRRLGYVPVRHIYESRLDLATFDPGSLAALPAAVADTGIRLFSLAQENTDAVHRSFYELCRENLLDNPAEDAQGGFEPFEEWRRFVIESGVFPADCILLAAEGDRVVSAVVLEPRSGHLYNRVAVTARSHRGRKLASTLKLLAVDVGRRYKVPSLYTENDSMNGPILAINKGMGYVAYPGTYHVEKMLCWFRGRGGGKAYLSSKDAMSPS